MLDLQAHVRAETEAAGLIGRRVLVAVSGGPDSVALFHILASLAGEERLGLHLCHVDHGWRPEAGEDETAICTNLARGAGVGWSVIHLPAPKTLSEAQARTARFAALRRVAESVGAEAIALGHQADDQAETVLMQLVRGTAHAGGMAGWRPPLWRPLLSVPRRELARYCEERGIAFASDPSNLSPAFARNRVRLEVLPLLRRENPRAAEAIGRFAALRREEDDWLEAQASALLHAMPRLPHGLDLRPLRTQPVPLQRRVLRQALAELGAALDADGLMALQQALQAGARSATAADLRLEHGMLYRPSPPPPWSSLPPGGQLLWGGLRFGAGPPPGGTLSADVGQGRLVVRARRPGDRMRLPGGTRKLQDILVDAKVPRSLRDALPVVCLEGRPVWLPGHVRAADAGVGRTVWVGSAEVVAQLWSVLE